MQICGVATLLINLAKSQNRKPSRLSLPPCHGNKIIKYLCCSCSSEQKQYLLDVGIFVVLQSILDSLTLSADVIAEVFCVIACLSDICKFPRCA